MSVTVTGRVASGSTWQADDMSTGWAAWTLIWDEEGSFHRLKITDRALWPVLEQARPDGLLRATGTPDEVYIWKINTTGLEVIDGGVRLDH